MAGRRYWTMSTLSDPETSRTWYVDSGRPMNTLLYRLLPEEDDYHFGPIMRWDDDAMLKCDRTKRFADIVWIGIRFAVSSRAKAIIEEIAPDHAQFLPVTMVWRRSVLPVKPYWVVNWNSQVDCWNRPVAEAEYISWLRRVNRGTSLRQARAEAKYMAHLIIDPFRVPDGTEAFMVKGSNHEVISQRLKLALTKAKISGCTFHTVPVADGPRKPANPRRYLRKFDVPEALKPANNLKTRLASLKIKHTGPRDFVRATVGNDATVEVGRGATEAGVKRLEQRLKLKLPKNYRDFLTSCGSAEIEGVEILGIPSRKADPTAAEATESMRKAKAFDWPAHMLCIADDGRGGYYCLDTSRAKGADCPVVYFDHELASEDGATGRLKPLFEKVKPTFKSWLKEIALTGEPGPY